MSSAKTAKDIILGESNTYHQWYSNLKDSVPSHLWRYFDPAGNAVFIQPVPPFQPVCQEVISPPVVLFASGHSTKSFQTLGDTLDPQAARKNARYKEGFDIYSKFYAIYWDKQVQWEKYSEINAKLRDCIKATISSKKAGPLSFKASTQQWFIDLKRATAPILATTKQTLKVEYKRLTRTELAA